MTGRALTAIVVLAIAAPLAAQAPVFRAIVGAVRVDVAVTQRGQPVTDLALPEFRLTDNGAAQTVLDVGRETLPIDVRLVVDLSGSLEGALPEVRRSIQNVATRLRPQDRSGLVVFDQQVREISPLQTGRLGVATDALHSPRGLTALLDAVAASIVVPTDADRRAMAIVFTDGNDVTSFLDERELVDLATRSEVAVFFVTLTDGTLRVPQQPRNAPLLRTLADATGGMLTVLQRDEDLGAAFVRALDEFRTRYVLRYVPTTGAGTGWHDIKVAVTRRGVFEIRARRGYFDAASEPR